MTWRAHITVDVEVPEEFPGHGTLMEYVRDLFEVSQLQIKGGFSIQGLKEGEYGV